MVECAPAAWRRLFGSGVWVCVLSLDQPCAASRHVLGGCADVCGVRAAPNSISVLLCERSAVQHDVLCSSWMVEWNAGPLCLISRPRLHAHLSHLHPRLQTTEGMVQAFSPDQLLGVQEEVQLREQDFGNFQGGWPAFGITSRAECETQRHQFAARLLHMEQVAGKELSQGT